MFAMESMSSTERMRTAGAMDEERKQLVQLLPLLPLLAGLGRTQHTIGGFGLTGGGQSPAGSPAVTSATTSATEPVRACRQPVPAQRFSRSGSPAAAAAARSGAVR